MPPVVRPHLRSSPTTSQIASLFLRLPPSYRSFHASPQPRFIDTAINSTHSLFEIIHSTTGLPWAYTLPLAALAIRTAIVLPISIYSRQRAQKQIELAPLIQGWQHQLRKETMLEVGHLGPAVASKTLAQKTRAKRNEIFARGRCPLWMNYSNLIQIPIWLTAIETIRMMCGQSRGLLGMAFGRGESLVDGVLTTGLPVEEAFATEGMLWFPNLLAADPHLVLPFMLSGIIFLNIGNGNGKSLWQIRLSRSLKVVALAVGPLTLHVPSAMLVYWISSSLFGYLQGIILDWAMPMKKAVKPCITNRRRLMIPLKQDPPMRK